MEKENSSSRRRRRHGKETFKLFGVEISTKISDHQEGGSKNLLTMEDPELSIKLNYGDDDGDHHDVLQLSTSHETGCSDHHDHKQKQKKEKKKDCNGNQWSREEHERFLIGLKEKGRGKWKEIATKFVKSRTKTQVASHAQKYFRRQDQGRQERKRRESIFDISLQHVTP